jgi:mRNA interferase MazF
MEVERFEVWLTNLDPTIGSEIRKARPCLVISPNEMNRQIRTVIIAPMTTQGYAYASRIDCEFAGKTGQILLDQLRSIDKSRFIKKLGQINEATQHETLDGLARLFTL